MDVDAPNLLKRCSSAPLINEAPATSATSPVTAAAPRNTPFFSMFSNSQARTRRHSSSFSPLAAPLNFTQQNSFGPRLTPRVNQLRAEECADLSNTREVAHEREVRSAMQMGQSCEDLTLADVGLGAAVPHSPTRVHRFSPLPVSVSPSPTRKFTTRRSLSPTITLRASPLAKRRGEDADCPLAKRLCVGHAGHGGRTPPTPTPATPPTPECLDCTFRPVSPRAPDARPKRPS